MTWWLARCTSGWEVFDDMVRVRDLAWSLRLCYGAWGKTVYFHSTSAVPLSPPMARSRNKCWENFWDNLTKTLTERSEKASGIAICLLPLCRFMLRTGTRISSGGVSHYGSSADVITVTIKIIQQLVATWDNSRTDLHRNSWLNSPPKYTSCSEHNHSREQGH